MNNVNIQNAKYNKNAFAFQSKAHLPLAKSTYNVTLTFVMSR